MGKAVSRALGVNKGGTVSRALGGSQNVGIAIGLVAAIAMPFALPAIATAIGSSLAVAPLAASTIAGGLYGAATGALAGSMTGNVGQGALVGGVGGAAGGFLQGGGIGATREALFGAAPTPATPEYGYAALAEPSGGFSQGGFTSGPSGFATGSGPALSSAELAAANTASSGSGIGAAFGSNPMPQTAMSFEPAAGSSSGYAFGAPVNTTAGIGGAAPGGAVSGGVASGGVAGGAGTAAPTGTAVERFFGGLTGGGTKMDLTTAEGVGRSLSGLVSPAGLASVGQLAMTMYNKPPEGLTAQERAFVDETASLASTNRELFDERVRAARRLLQQGTPNPEQAFAQSNIAFQRRIREAGLRSPEDERRALIEGTRLGAAAIPGEYARAAGATQAGLTAMPTTAPAGAASMALPAYRDVERRQREYEASLSKSLGGLAGALGGSRGKLFS